MDRVTIEIEKITVLLRDGTDIIYIQTSLPPSFVPEVSKESLVLQFEATKGMGVDYVRVVFGIEPTVIDTQIPEKELKPDTPFDTDQWTNAESSNLDGYGVKGDDLIVRFKNGSAYRYPGKAHFHLVLSEAESKGKAFHRIKAALKDFERLS